MKETITQTQGMETLHLINLQNQIAQLDIRKAGDRKKLTELCDEIIMIRRGESVSDRTADYKSKNKR
jgi:ABC-type Na+ transport system ATPase subunit NatA